MKGKLVILASLLFPLFVFSEEKGSPKPLSSPTPDQGYMARMEGDEARILFHGMKKLKVEKWFEEPGCGGEYKTGKHFRCYKSVCGAPKKRIEYYCLSLVLPNGSMSVNFDPL